MALINANLILQSDIPHYIYNISVQYQLESLFAVCMPRKFMSKKYLFRTSTRLSVDPVDVL